MRKIIVIGATSTIALEVQRQLARRGWELLVVVGSHPRLTEIQADLLVRGVPEVLVYPADVSCIAEHNGVLEFASRMLPDFDTVLLAYGSMHDQKIAATSIPVLLDELQVDFVSAAALLTLFAADLERRRM